MRGCLVFIGLTTLMMSAQAAGWQKSNCNAFDEAATAQANIMDPIMKAVAKAYPKGDFLSPSCASAEIQKISKTSAKFRVVFELQCLPDEVPNSVYLCTDANGKHVGDLKYQAEILASCAGTLGQENSCNKITKGPVDITPKTPVSSPSPSPQGVWINTAWNYVPEDVKKANIAKAKAVTPITQVAKIREVTIIQNVQRKEDAKGIAYKMESVVISKSLATTCSYPFLIQDFTMEIYKPKTGAIKYQKVTPETPYAATGKEPDQEEVPACVGGADWKKGVAKADAFIKSL